MTDPVKPGTVWADKDPREVGRTVRVDSVDNQYVLCTVLTAASRRGEGARTGHRTRILLDRLLYNFRLVDEGDQ
jgi:hypothetical protein